MHPDSCTNTHHDFTDLINHGMVKNIKTFHIVRMENNFSMKQKKFLICASDDTLERLSFCSGGNL